MTEGRWETLTLERVVETSTPSSISSTATQNDHSACRPQKRADRKIIQSRDACATRESRVVCRKSDDDPRHLRLPILCTLIDSEQRREAVSRRDTDQELQAVLAPQQRCLRSVLQPAKIFLLCGAECAVGVHQWTGSRVHPDQRLSNERDEPRGDWCRCEPRTRSSKSPR